MPLVGLPSDSPWLGPWHQPEADVRDDKHHCRMTEMRRSKRSWQGKSGRLSYLAEVLRNVGDIFRRYVRVIRQI